MRGPNPTESVEFTCIIIICTGLTSPTKDAPDKATAKRAAWGMGWREGRYGRDIDVSQYKRLTVA